MLSAAEVEWLATVTKNGTLDPDCARELACDVLVQTQDAQLAGILVDWRDFEKLVASLLELADFDVRSPFRYKSLTSRGEMDVVAVRDNTVLFIDCKRYSRSRNTSSHMRAAAFEQRERVEQFVDVFPQLACDLIRSKGKYLLVPLIVPWVGAETVFESSAVIVPCSSLPLFVSRLDGMIHDLPHLVLELC